MYYLCVIILLIHILDTVMPIIVGSTKKLAHTIIGEGIVLIIYIFSSI